MFSYSKAKLSFCLLFALTLSAAARLNAALQVQLTPSLTAPQPVGTSITWTAAVTDSFGGAHEFQFSVALSNGPFAIVHDFNITTSFPWTPSRTEGSYQIRVVAKNVSTAETAQTTQTFVVTPRLVAGHAAVNATAHPLVALFSAPPCTAGNLVRVRFAKSGSAVSQTTNAVGCSSTNSANFYIAGMLPSTTYNMHYETLTSTGVFVRAGNDYPFTTGPLPSSIPFPAVTVPNPADPPTSISNPVLLHDYLPIVPGNTSAPKPVVTATDLTGNVIWYYPKPVSLMTRTETGGNMFVLYTGVTDTHLGFFREIDLAGNIILETNVNRINEQLLLAGKRKIGAFHHEARRLKNGYIAILGSNEMLVTNAQGGTPSQPVDVLGAEVIVLDSNLQLVWSWDAFDHLDITRSAVLGDVCTAGQIGCPVFFLAASANDWLHANSVQETPDGGMLISLRHQDWVIKVDYANGAGSGALLWRLGAGGDFSINSADPCPWFSGQHDANFQDPGMTVLSVFDNGNTRRANCNPNGNSRGYVMSVNQATMQVTPTLMADLGGFSTGLGTAQLLPGGNYHFESGWILPGSFSRSKEIKPDGSTVFAMQEQGLTYRSYRMADLYTPAAP